jgi:hypothetical protein
MFLFLVYKELQWFKYIHWIVNCLSAGNSFIIKFILKFLLKLSSRSVFHIGVILKYMLLWSISHLDRTHYSLIVTDNGTDNCRPLLTNHNAVKQSTKLITSLNSKHYRPSGILIHRQNSYAPCSWWCTGCCEQSIKVRTSLYNGHSCTEVAAAKDWPTCMWWDCIMTQAHMFFMHMEKMFVNDEL